MTTNRTMELSCPCCRATNATPTCRRCKADLSLLFAGENSRAYHLTSAQRCIANGQYDDAIIHLDAAEAIRRDVDVHRLRACVHLLQADYNSALRSYNRML